MLVLDCVDVCLFVIEGVPGLGIEASVCECSGGGGGTGTGRLLVVDEFF